MVVHSDYFVRQIRRNLSGLRLKNGLGLVSKVQRRFEISQKDKRAIAVLSVLTTHAKNSCVQHMVRNVSHTTTLMYTSLI